MADLAERLAQPNFEPIGWLLRERPWHPSADGPCPLTAHLAPGIDVQFLSAASPLFPLRSLDWPTHLATPPVLLLVFPNPNLLLQTLNVVHSPPQLEEEVEMMQRQRPVQLS